ncbi:hypothetical protein TWF481_003748 [Arthrobotrys musiformis]|uniref:Uncharacterized protein n=1 Tax=Arthrobotrys musiformis TaxID=47236 RepID=A0AAV9WJG9_9PEZI
MPRYTCHHALRLLTPSTIRTLDSTHHFHTTTLSTTHRIWDPSYPTFISTTHTSDECFDLSHRHGNDTPSYEEQIKWRERLVGKKLVNGNTHVEDGMKDKVYNIQSLPAGNSTTEPTCTRIIGPLKTAGFSEMVGSRLTVHVDGDDVVWDVYFG